MKGQLAAGHNALFDELCVGRYIPPDHLLRQIDGLSIEAA